MYYGIPILAAIYVIMVQYYKRYLIACEYLQIDPTFEYSVEDINNRIKFALSQWAAEENQNDYKKFRKTLLWLLKSYKYCVGWWYGFVKKSKKLLDKGQLIINIDTVSLEYIKKPIEQTNYDFYANKQNKMTLILLAIIVPILIIFFIIIGTI
ncbi:MAG: hypothetical protein LBT30_03790 [Clostridiales bacterium]|jgi:hypothetical protein|nr:hypothetical protein [Clostridiales bacterium]